MRKAEDRKELHRGNLKTSEITAYYYYSMSWVGWGLCRRRSLFLHRIYLDIYRWTVTYHENCYNLFSSRFSTTQTVEERKQMWPHTDQWIRVKGAYVLIILLLLFLVLWKFFNTKWGPRSQKAWAWVLPGSVHWSSSWSFSILASWPVNRTVTILKVSTT